MAYQTYANTPNGIKMSAMIKTRTDESLVEMFRMVDKGFDATREERIVWDFLFEEMQQRGIITYNDDTEEFYLYGEMM